MACRMGQQSATNYIHELRKNLVNCADVLKSEAKFIFEMNSASWLSALVLSYNCTGLHTTMLYAEQIGSIQQHPSAHTNQNKL